MALSASADYYKSQIPQSFMQVPLLSRRSLDAFCTPAWGFTDLCTCVLNILDRKAAHTNGSICSQLISFATPTRSQAVIKYWVNLSDGPIFTMQGCHR